VQRVQHAACNLQRVQHETCSMQHAAVIRTGAMTLAGMVKLGDFGLSQSVGPDGLLHKTAGTEALPHSVRIPCGTVFHPVWLRSSAPASSEDPTYGRSARRARCSVKQAELCALRFDTRSPGMLRARKLPKRTRARQLGPDWCRLLRRALRRLLSITVYRLACIEPCSLLAGAGTIPFFAPEMLQRKPFDVRQQPSPASAAVTCS